MELEMGVMDTTGSDQVEKTTSQPSNRFRDAFAVGVVGLFIVAFVLISQTSQEMSTLTETDKQTNEELPRRRRT